MFISQKKVIVCVVVALACDAGSAINPSGWEDTLPIELRRNLAPPVVALTAETDTAPDGDWRTTLANVDLEGTIAPLIPVTVGTKSTVSDAHGRWRLSGLHLQYGVNTFQVRLGEETTTVQVLRKAPESPVIAWNEEALDAARKDRPAPPTLARHLAIMHLATHSAVRATSQTADQSAAVSAAAHGYLSRAFPNRRAEFDRALESQVTSASMVSLTTGRECAKRWFLSRVDDGSTIPYTMNDKYNPVSEPGKWRRTAPGFRKTVLPKFGKVRPFLVASLDLETTASFPGLQSEEYAQQIDIVRRLGRRETSDRTPEQTSIAYFWAGQVGTATPVGHWNSIAAAVVRQKQLPLDQEAEVFAHLNVALANAGIACWDLKYKHDTWRPITAIQEADSDDNPQTTPDKTWEPLLITPPFPDYPSGHSMFSGAAATVLTHYFGPNCAFVSSSDNLPLQFGIPNSERSFNSFEDAAVEASQSRVYGGIHYPISCSDGLDFGAAVARLSLGQSLPE